MSPNRIVAVATPLLFAPLAGGVSAWLAVHFPGFNIDRGALEEIFIAGALIALAPAAQWLHGWQKYEARRAEQEAAVELANVASPPAAPAAGGEADFEEPAEPEDFDVSMESDVSIESDELDDLDALDEELFADEQLAETGS